MPHVSWGFLASQRAGSSVLAPALSLPSHQLHPLPSCLCALTPALAPSLSVPCCQRWPPSPHFYPVSNPLSPSLSPFHCRRPPNVAFRQAPTSRGPLSALLPACSRGPPLASLSSRLLSLSLQVDKMTLHLIHSLVSFAQNLATLLLGLLPWLWQVGASTLAETSWPKPQVLRESCFSCRTAEAFLFVSGDAAEALSSG